VASLWQTPLDPFERPTSHCPLDFWGRNLIDHLVTLLPRLLGEHGVAYVMQLSVLGQLRAQAAIGGRQDASSTGVRWLRAPGPPSAMAAFAVTRW
jgi:hypothetical protein